MIYCNNQAFIIVNDENPNKVEGSGGGGQRLEKNKNFSIKRAIEDFLLMFVPVNKSGERKREEGRYL